MISMKKLLITLLIPATALLSCSKSSDNNSKKSASIVVSGTTNEGVKDITSRTPNDTPPAVNDFWLEITGPGGYVLGPQVLGEGRVIPDVVPGNYTVSLTSHKDEDFGMPAFDKRIFKAEMSKNVTSGSPTKFELVCKQFNAGVRFAFDATVVTYYDDPNVTILDKYAPTKSIDYTTQHETDGKIAYFDAPSTLRVYFKDGATPVKIGGKDYADIQVASRERWTITLKTSHQSEGDVEIDVTVDTDADEKDPDFGVGEVSGKGTAASPYSVKDAINAMPVKGWVHGVIVGSGALGRDASSDHILLGASIDSPASECLIFELPAGSDLRKKLNVVDNPSNIGMGVAVYGNVEGKKYAGVTTTAFAVISDVSNWNMNYFTDVTKSISRKFDKVLKDASFPIGAASSHEHLESDPTNVQILRRDISSLSSIYTMKMDYIWRARDRYEFADVDKLVNFAQDNGMRMHGHTLVWAQTIPDWVRELDWPNGDPRWAELMEEYITTVVGRYKGKVASWDVVNEPFNDRDGSLRGSGMEDTDTFWYDKVGSDFIEKALKAARAADPACKLFLNDYKLIGFDYIAKRNGILSYIKNTLQANNIPIDGIGMQCHEDIYTHYENAVASFTAFADLGLLVHASELDMTINNPGFISGWLLKGREVTDLYTDPDFMQIDYAQGKSFNMVVRAYINSVPQAQRYGITVWGLSDKHSMADGNVFKKPDWPAMFGKSYQPKRAYHAVLEGLQGIDWTEEEQGYGGIAWRWENGYEDNPNL